MEIPTKSPEPFLGPIFETGQAAPILAGWYYTESDAVRFGFREHGAIDFAVPIGTPIRAAQGGWAVATFGEATLLDAAGVPVTEGGRQLYYGPGLTVQIWHGRGRYTQYCHLSQTAEGIPFHKPEVSERGNLRVTGLTARVSDYGRTVAAMKVRTGEVIGWSGLTGMGIGVRTYEHWRSGQDYAAYTDPHLHFVVLGGRDPRTREAVRYDPFGLYAEASDYPKNPGDWSKHARALWVPSRY